jgi:feruloyl esterase
LADLYVTFAWGQLAARDSGDKLLLTLPDLALLTRAALKLCDQDDGLADGIIGDPAHCAFRPAVLACQRGQTTGCLTAAQIRAAERIYSGPTNSAGQSLFSAGAAPGSELGGKPEQALGGNWAIYYTGNGPTPALYRSITENGLHYVFRDSELGLGWTIKDFDFDEDYKRLDVMQSLYDSSNPDLSRFRQAGGKMIIYEGLNDLSILPQWITAYYHKVEAVMGGPKATKEFVRLFHLPGVEHCAGGPGADVVDYLAAIENWVEANQAPEKLQAYHLKDSLSLASAVRDFPIPAAQVEFSRPVYPYPLVARYLGRGDPNSAESFEAVMPKP